MFRITSIILLLITNLNIRSQNASYQLNGDATSNNVTDRNGTVSCKCFQLTSNTTSQQGSVWNRNKIDLNNSFVLDFDIYLGKYRNLKQNYC